MIRVHGWEKRLRLVIEKHMALESEYAVSDCFIISMDAYEAVTGEQITPHDRALIDYHDEKTALRRLREHGYESVEDLFDKHLEQIPPPLGQRGDLGVADVGGIVAGGVFTQLGFMTRGPKRVVFLPVSDVKKAYKVG